MKTLGVDELTERINEILRIVEEEGETIEVTKRGKVIAHLVPVRGAQQPAKRDLKAFFAEMDRLAAEIGAHWKGDMDAVEAVRDVRRDL
jgi:prevent-host-death family protein